MGLGSTELAPTLGTHRFPSWHLQGGPAGGALGARAPGSPEEGASLLLETGREAGPDCVLGGPGVGGGCRTQGPVPPGGPEQEVKPVAGAGSDKQLGRSPPPPQERLAKDTELMSKCPATRSMLHSQSSSPEGPNHVTSWGGRALKTEIWDCRGLRAETKWSPVARKEAPRHCVEAEGHRARGRGAGHARTVEGGAQAGQAPREAGTVTGGGASLPLTTCPPPPLAAPHVLTEPCAHQDPDPLSDPTGDELPPTQAARGSSLGSLRSGLSPGSKHPCTSPTDQRPSPPAPCRLWGTGNRWGASPQRPRPEGCPRPPPLGEAAGSAARGWRPHRQHKTRRCPVSCPPVPREEPAASGPRVCRRDPLCQFNRPHAPCHRQERRNDAPEQPLWVSLLVALGGLGVT